VAAIHGGDDHRAASVMIMNTAYAPKACAINFALTAAHPADAEGDA